MRKKTREKRKRKDDEVVMAEEGNQSSLVQNTTAQGIHTRMIPFTPGRSMGQFLCKDYYARCFSIE